VSFFVRATKNFEALPGAVRTLAAALDNTVPVFGVHTMDEQVQEALFTDRMIAALATAFGALAVVLTAVGLYGVIAYLVTRRTTEIGVRMALGATRSNIVAIVLSEVAVVLGVGGAVGLIAAYGAGRGLESQLFGMRGFDPLVFACAPAILIAVALLSAGMPAWRAARIQPLEALRHE
jgi:ABC-type antimicrobial peptide transport system permease subunit